MKTITKPVYNSKMLKFAATYAQAENLGGAELETVIKELGITLEDVNTAFRKAKKQYYDVALESTPETRLEAARKSMQDLGIDEDEINTFIESARAKAKNTLPKGLTPVFAEDGKTQVVGKPRGRAAANASEDKPAA